MKLFPSRPQEQQQPAHPETAVASRAVQAEVAPISDERHHTVFAAWKNVTGHRVSEEYTAQDIINMPEWQPAVHSQYSNTAPAAAPVAESFSEDDLIDPALGYAKADIMTISHDVVASEAEAITRAAVQNAYEPQLYPQQESAPAPWQERTEAGIANPYVPKVAVDIDRLSADIEQERNLEAIRSRIQGIQG